MAEEWPRHRGCHVEPSRARPGDFVRCGNLHRRQQRPRCPRLHLASPRAGRRRDRAVVESFRPWCRRPRRRPGPRFRFRGRSEQPVEKTPPAGHRPDLGAFRCAQPVAPARPSHLRPQRPALHQRATPTRPSSAARPTKATWPIRRRARGAFPLPENTADVALLMPFSTGAYTAHITSGDGTAGAVLFEIYEVP